MRIWGLSKTQANYRPAPRREVRCARCEYMFPPLAVGGCRLVRGPIRGTATCDQAPPRPHRYIEETEPGVRLAQRLPSAPTGIPGSDFLDGSRVRLATIPPPHPLWTIS